MWKKNRKGERDSSKFMYFHEKEVARMLNDTRVKIRERKRNNVQILRDGSRLILDEITKSVGLSRRTEIYGVNFVDSPVETVLILHLHMYPYIIFPARVLYWETSLAKSTHACSNIRTNCSRTFSILSRGEELKTWLLKRVITRLKLYFSIIYFFSFIKLHYLIKYYYRNSWTKVDGNYSNL